MLFKINIWHNTSQRKHQNHILFKYGKYIPWQFLNRYTSSGIKLHMDHNDSWFELCKDHISASCVSGYSTVQKQSYGCPGIQLL